MANHTPITVTFWQFQASLSEYLDARLLLAYTAECFAFYIAGATVQQAAQAVTEIDRRPDL